MLFLDELFHIGTKQRFDGDPNGSGRYRKGSGENPHQHGTGTYYDRIDELQALGWTTTQIAHDIGISTTKLRAIISIKKEEQIAAETARCLELQDQGLNRTQISEITGIKPSTVANRLKPIEESRKTKNREVADFLKEEIENGKPYLDVGDGVERQLNISKTRLETAIKMLEEEGYKISTPHIEQATNPGQKTTFKVLTKEEVPYGEIWQNRDQIISPMGKYYDEDSGHMRVIQPPINIDSSRIAVRYAEQGGDLKDGVIELRPGAQDLSLGQSAYAQVRIAVDGTHYLKGMAMFSKDLPPGVDILFNTSKHEGTPMLGSKDDTVLKPLKDDPDNPFGSTIRQLKDSEGKVYSACNIVNEDADWDKWSKNLSSQFLSKQNPDLAKRQLDIAYESKKSEFDRICKIPNEAVKKHLLLSFADECDSDAVELKGAALPRQSTKVILPLTTIKDNEVYAPGYKTGEQVALVRYPHQGIFEIPVLTVNNNNREGRDILGEPKNAIGINLKTANKLSGADFDGDTVVVIPLKNQNIKTARTPASLENFDPKEMYKLPKDSPEVGPKTGFVKGTEMGKISNLITDMSLQGATMDKIVRATKHAQVVIDAEKHHLDWRRSYEVNRIAELKEEFQGGKDRGAATVISKASSDERVPERKTFRETARKEDGSGGDIDPKTGKKLYRETGELNYSYKYKYETGEQEYSYKRAYIDDSGKTRSRKQIVFKDKNGNFYYEDDSTGKKISVSSDLVKSKPVTKTEDRAVFPDKNGNFYYKDKVTGERTPVPADKVKAVPRLEKSNKMTEAFNRGGDAYDLVFDKDNRIEKYYANYANRMKALGNEARKEYLATPNPRVNKSAKQTYSEEVDSLTRKLNTALQNAPSERQANALVSSQISKLRKYNPELVNDEKAMKKKRAQLIAEARVRTGALDRKKRNIEITDREWEAIQANAISNETLKKVFRNTDSKKLKERAMPISSYSISSYSISRARSLMKMGYTQEEAAEAVGVSVSTLNRAL